MISSRFGVALVASLAVATCAPVGAVTFLHKESEMWAPGHEEAPELAADDTLVFAAVGDQGDATQMQAAVARAITTVCDDRCQFVVLLGDNLYEEGIVDQNDADTIACIVESYPTDHKFMVLGNHDYEILTPTLERARRELAWIRSSAGQEAGARGGHHFYSFEVGPVRFKALDTNYLVRGRVDAHYREIVTGIGRVRHRPDGWTIVFGHHPFLSNGEHGSAGSFRDGGLSIWPGAFFRYFMEQHIVARADLYIAGHDHSMQFFPGAETAFAVVGSGSRCTGRGTGADRGPWFQHYGHGFMLIEASKTRLALRFFGFDARPLWGVVRTQKEPWRSLEGFPARLRSEETRCGAELAAVAAAKPIEGCWQEH